MSEFTNKLDLENLVQLIEKDSGLIDKETAFKIFRLVTDEYGYFKESFDPYRHTNELFYNLLFNEDGNPHWYVFDFLETYLESYDIGWKCDLTKLYHSLRMDSITHGNYSTIYAWR